MTNKESCKKDDEKSLSERVLISIIHVSVGLLVMSFCPFVFPLALMPGLDTIALTIAACLLVLALLIGTPAAVIWLLS